MGTVRTKRFTTYQFQFFVFLTSIFSRFILEIISVISCLAPELIVLT